VNARVRTRQGDQCTSAPRHGGRSYGPRILPSCSPRVRDIALPSSPSQSGNNRWLGTSRPSAKASPHRSRPPHARWLRLPVAHSFPPHFTLYTLWAWVHLTRLDSGMSPRTLPGNVLRRPKSRTCWPIDPSLTFPIETILVGSHIHIYSASKPRSPSLTRLDNSSAF
jgi:hypothetical protein